MSELTDSATSSRENASGSDKTSGAEIASASFVSIPIATMQPDTAAPVDLYIHDQGQGRFLLYKKAGVDLSDEMRQRLLDHGVQSLYYHVGDKAAYCAYAEKHLSNILGEELLPAEQIWPIVYETSTHVMKEVFASPRSGTNLKRAERMVEPIVSSLITNPERVKKVTSLLSHDYYTYTHSVNVCIFLVAASHLLLGIQDKTELLEIGQGAILHDIGKSEIPKDILNKPGKLTEDEFRKVKKHPLLGLDIAANHTALSPHAVEIIRSHHEHFDGSGYPDGLAGGKIPLVVRLATLVDVYDALTTNRPYAPAMDVRAALSTMIYEMHNHFDVHFMRAFVAFFGPRLSMQEEAQNLTTTYALSTACRESASPQPVLPPNEPGPE